MKICSWGTQKQLHYCCYGPFLIVRNTALCCRVIRHYQALRYHSILTITLLNNRHDLLHDWQIPQNGTSSILHVCLFLSSAIEGVPDCHLRSYTSTDEVCNTYDLESDDCNSSSSISSAIWPGVMNVWEGGTHVVGVLFKGCHLRRR